MEYRPELFFPSASSNRSVLSLFRWLPPADRYLFIPPADGRLRGALIASGQQLRFHPGPAPADTAFSAGEYYIPGIYSRIWIIHSKKIPGLVVPAGRLCYIRKNGKEEGKKVSG